jgi:membrane fusion protein, peptide pheromone/bacteriocin exporter
MKELFPPEIIENSVESNFSRNNRKTRIIYTLVIIAFLSFITALPYIYIDISTQSRGIVRARLDNNQLIPTVYSRIEWLNIYENQIVHKNDTLMKLNNEKTANQIRLNEYLIAENQKYINDLNQLINGSSNVITPKYKMALIEFQRQKDDYETRIAKAKHEYELAKDLYELKVGVKTEYDQNKYNYELAQSALKVYEDQQRSSWQNAISQLIIDNNQYKSQIGQLKEELKLYYIIAPVNGTITNYTGLQKGNFVVPNQPIAYISPMDDLLVECYISPSDIGYIKTNMEAVYQIDAYNYNQWGQGKGIVQEISDDIVTLNEKPYFKVRCNLETKTLHLKNGVTGRLKKGMTLTGRFKINRRSLFQLLYDKTDNWLNPNVFTVTE